jgi:methionine sulfoxide reductase heme-binding subunit
LRRKTASFFTLRDALFICALLPFFLMVRDIIIDNLGANPVESLLNRSGLWALRFLLITLSVSPLHRLIKKIPIMKYRRMLGLFCFFYATVHVLIFVGLEHGWSWDFIIDAIYSSPAVDVGLLVYLFLMPLAITSTNKMMRRLGKYWKRLHNTVHIAAYLSILHFALSEKADISTPLVYGLILLFLLLIRVITRRIKQKVLLKRLKLQHH